MKVLSRSKHSESGLINNAERQVNEHVYRSRTTKIKETTRRYSLSAVWVFTVHFAPPTYFSMKNINPKEKSNSLLLSMLEILEAQRTQISKPGHFWPCPRAGRRRPSAAGVAVDVLLVTMGARPPAHANTSRGGVHRWAAGAGRTFPA